MKVKINPCKDCTKRQVGCHGSCKEYGEWRAKRDESLTALYLENRHAYELRERAQRKQIAKRLRGR